MGGERRIADDAEGAIVHIAKRLDKAGATLSQVFRLPLTFRGASHPGFLQAGIQFVQIGSDHNARIFLEKLDNDLKEKYSIRVRTGHRFLHLV